MDTGEKKIMIIENDEMTIEILKFIFKKEGYKISIAKDGINAIERMATIMPNLVITTITIPLKSGLEIISYIKKNFKDIRVVALSSLGEEENTVEEAFELGVDDFIAKPFNPNELLLRIKRFL
ncbi:response regulator receiver domain-containing protein [Flavobacterium sp. 90]|uniref:response regulator transcription factor n=1 Tax=unclassified Flavobacterium TaxID=196869 RepID=UPI000EADBEA5|nr:MULTISPECIES: response regulator [unclassified Flavobacterium]RKR08434.1 response regulator receiver domain-containing protein [Flavobacterium sp. 81]TCK52229.1 response regulator receiver domain-containing protein [Flavobacterium sp. 90]